MPVHRAHRNSESSIPLEPVTRPAPFFARFMEPRPQSRVKEPAQPFGPAIIPSMSVTEQFQQFLSQCDEQALMGLLRTLQVRLGTPREAADDIDRATAVMHQLNNV